MHRRKAFQLLTGAALAGTAVSSARALKTSECSTRDHAVWVIEVLKQMQTVKPGMTRGELLKIFTTEGGLSTPLERTYVSRDCGCFKVNVEFQAVVRPDHDESGRVTPSEDDRDLILKISEPYLQFGIYD